MYVKEFMLKRLPAFEYKVPVNLIFHGNCIIYILNYTYI